MNAFGNAADSAQFQIPIERQSDRRSHEGFGDRQRASRETVRGWMVMGAASPPSPGFYFCAIEGMFNAVGAGIGDVHDARGRDPRAAKAGLELNPVQARESPVIR